MYRECSLERLEELEETLTLDVIEEDYEYVSPLSRYDKHGLKNFTASAHTYSTRNKKQ